MKLARVIRNAEGVWYLVCPSGSIRRPPRGATVQYDEYAGVFRVCFPGVRGYAPIGRELFDRYFEDLDDEVS